MLAFTEVSVFYVVCWLIYIFPHPTLNPFCSSLAYFMPQETYFYWLYCLGPSFSTSLLFIRLSSFLSLFLSLRPSGKKSFLLFLEPLFFPLPLPASLDIALLFNSFQLKHLSVPSVPTQTPIYLAKKIDVLNGIKKDRLRQIFVTHVINKDLPFLV